MSDLAYLGGEAKLLGIKPPPLPKNSPLLQTGLVPEPSGTTLNVPASLILVTRVVAGSRCLAFKFLLPDLPLEARFLPI